MKYKIKLIIPPEKIYDPYYLREIASKKLGIKYGDISTVVQLRRSIDARRLPVYKILAEVYVGEYTSGEKHKYIYNPVDGKKKVIVVGFGPAGIYAALRLIELGIKPVIIERGKD